MTDTTTSGLNTFDTLCSTWKDQLKTTPLKGSNNQKVDDSVDLLLSNLLEDIWLQCEKLFRQSKIPTADIKFTTDNFCLHVMNQLISTHNKLYEIKRKKPQEHTSLIDNQTPIEENVQTNSNNKFTHVIPCTDKPLSSPIDDHEYSEYSKQNDLQLNKPSHSKCIVEYEKNNRHSQLFRLEESQPFTHLHSPLNNDQSTSMYQDKESKIFKFLDEGTSEEKCEESICIENTNQTSSLEGNEGSTKIEITDSIPMNYFDNVISVAPRHRSSPVLMLKPVYTKCKTIKALPCLLDHKDQQNSSYSSFTTLNDTGTSRTSILRLLPKKIRPSHLFQAKKGSL